MHAGFVFIANYRFYFRGPMTLDAAAGEAMAILGTVHVIYKCDDTEALRSKSRHLDHAFMP